MQGPRNEQSMKTDRDPVNDQSRQRGDAGLPALERWAGGVGVKLFASFSSRERVVDAFRSEAERVIALAAAVPEEVGRSPARVRRAAGMEPSSCDWSVYMALEHLVIVNRGITAVIHALCADQNPGVEIRIEDIQPHVDAGPEQIEALGRAVDRYIEIVERFGGLNCRERYLHPWFGPLTACEWNVLAAWHNRIHRGQVQRVLRAKGFAAPR